MTQRMNQGATAEDLIAALGLSPHPEGGWYRETLRVPTATGGRSQATAILFLLQAGQASHWHRVDATEIWFWHAGAPLSVGRAALGTDEAQWMRLGPDVLAGEAVQHIIPAGHWQATVADSGWALVSCVVAPGFEFEGFELAAPGWHPGRPG